MKGHVEVLRCLYELVPDTLQAQDNIARRPTDCAAMEGHVRIEHFLKVTRVCTRLMAAVLLRKSCRVAQLLHDGADPLVKVSQGDDLYTAFSLAANQPPH